MVILTVEEGDRSFLSANPGEEIEPMNLISYSGDEATNATATDGIDGVALRVQNAFWGAEHDEDYRDPFSLFTYSPDDPGRMPFYPLGDEGAVKVRLKTPDDPGDGTTAPSWGVDSVVGVIDEYPGRVVEEGYSADFTDDATDNPTTFNEENGNFVPIGRVRTTAPTSPGSGFNEMVHVITNG